METTKPCKYGAACKNSSCKFSHNTPKQGFHNKSPKKPTSAKKPIPPSPQDTLGDCPYGIDCYDPACAFQKHPAERILCPKKNQCNDSLCDLKHPPQCRDHPKCTRSDCLFSHRDAQETCTSGCSNFFCSKLHPEDRLELCYEGSKCCNTDCDRLHPKDCKNGSMCTLAACKYRHPEGRVDVCPNDEKCNDIDCPYQHTTPFCFEPESCWNYDCKYKHVASRRQVCKKGISCKAFDCKLAHPPRRRPTCSAGDGCLDTKCSLLHPAWWLVCPHGIDCSTFECTMAHPKKRTPKCQLGASCINSDCPLLHPQNWDRDSLTSLKTPEQRHKDRLKASLPMLASKDQFIARLTAEKVLIVTAETGSGKTTQLPQYCAEAFGGQIICTQPRAIAAMTIAERIANEYDGTGTGNNVGYEVGGSKKKGAIITLMTDASLVRMAQRDQTLKQVTVLIIDEAHERSLNTDLVIGLSKLVMQKRPHDFYVVIASATIDERPFLNYYFGNGPLHKTALKVPGRVFPVTKEYKPPKAQDDVLGTFLIEQVVDTLTSHGRGHCLVFLPGSGEVDKAIKHFSAHSRRNDNWIPLPLYGSLPPEEQNLIMTFDDEKETKRMIVFCTNIAETSLTVPGVRIVIDTGLAKEARYDPKRRITILESVMISKSSADQRCGRAGRICEGHCVRLYAESDLTRQSILPEIQRSSLDLVALQLCRLGYNPLTFPFVDQPELALMKASLELLVKIGCVVQGNTWRTTELGNRFTDLPFDPRMSQFVEHTKKAGNISLGAQIAAILTAPGSIFFMGGSAKEAKEAARTRVATAAAEHESDMLFLLSVYNSWEQYGRCDATKKCVTCKKPGAKQGCKSCLAKWAREKGLNRKVLDYISTTVKNVLKIYRLNATEALSGEKSAEIIGRGLAAAFPEQIGELLIPDNPHSGVYFPHSTLVGGLTNNCTLVQNTVASLKFLIAMSATELPSGKVVLDKAHPIQIDWVSETDKKALQEGALNMVVCYSRKNLGKMFDRQLSNHFRSTKTEYSALTCVTHDGHKAILSVYGPKRFSQQIKSECEKIVEDLLQSEIEYEYVHVNSDGLANITFTGGLKVDKLEQISLACRVKFYNPPNVKDDISFVTWVASKLKIDKKEIKWSKFFPKDNQTESNGIVAFRNDKIAKLGAILAQEYSPKSTMLVDSASRGKNFLLKLGHSNIEGYLESVGVTPIAIQRIREEKPIFELLLRNVPHGVPAEIFTKKHLPCLYSQMTPDKNNPNVNLVFLKFSSAEERQNAMTLISMQTWAQQPSEVSIPGRNGPRLKSVVLNFKPKDIMGYSLVKLSFVSSEEADRSYSSCLGTGSTKEEVRVVGMKFYPNLETTIKQIANNFGCFPIIKPPRETEGRSLETHIVEFTGGLPSNCGRAAKKLESMVTPLQMRLPTAEQQGLYTELHTSGKLKEWSKKLNLGLEVDYRRETCLGFKLFGEQVKQGLFMAQIAEYHTASFKPRWKQIDLTDPNIVAKFRRAGPGERFIKNINDNTVSVKFSAISSNISILVDPSHQQSVTRILKSVTQEIENFVSKGNEKNSASTTCVGCGSSSAAPLAICGHKLCFDCLGQCKAPKNCPQCDTPISIKNLRTLNPSTFDNLCLAGLRHYFKTEGHATYALCSNSGCGGLMLRKAGYSRCLSCYTDNCPLCGAVDEPLHIDNTCEEFKKKKKAAVAWSFEELFVSASKFGRENWDDSIGKITGVYPNLSLLDGCPAAQRYCNALMKIGIEQADSSTFFAWHGTSAAVSICCEGFDTHRRSGQACGRGEYFGQNCGVSHGYSKNTGQMIVCQLIQVPETSTHGNFCYVVDNPTDHSLAYCVPLVVITYGSGQAPNFIRRAPAALPDLRRLDEAVVLSNNNQYTTPYHWYWYNDGPFEPYSDFINFMIEEAYEIEYLQNKNSHFVTPEISRYLDDRPQRYIIDFVNNIQMNQKTRWQRRIERRMVPVEQGEFEWFYKVNGVWYKFESLIQHTIEQAYTAYVNGGGRSIADIETPGRREKYILNFVRGTQTNSETQTCRDIRRMPKNHVCLTEQIVLQYNTTCPMRKVGDATSRFQRQHLNALLARIQCRNGKVQINVVVEKCQVMLHVDGDALKMLENIIGQVQNFIQIETGYTPSGIVAEGEYGSSMLKRPNLLKLSQDNIAIPSGSAMKRSDALGIIANVLIWKAKCELIGGFVRDWVINNEESDKIKALPTHDVATTISTIVDGVAAWMNLTSTSPQGTTYSLEFSGNWYGKNIQVDLVQPTVKLTAPYVSTDVSNLCIGDQGILKKRVTKAGEPQLSLAKCLQHARKKQFVFLYDLWNCAPDQRQRCVQKLLKYLNRGWVCLTHVTIPELQQYRNLIVYKQKYYLQWWA